MSREFSADPDDDFETDWEAERRQLRAQLAAPQGEIKLERALHNSISESRVIYAAELAKVTDLLREIFDAFCCAVILDDDRPARRDAAWKAAHAYLTAGKGET